VAGSKLFDWASPFDYVVWIVIGFEIMIVRALPHAYIHAWVLVFVLVCVKSLPQSRPPSFCHGPRKCLLRRLRTEKSLRTEQCGFAIYLVEYQADNDAFPTNPLTRLFVTMYYSFTIVLGCADAQPVTHGGRVIVLAQLFLTVILQAVFTGNLNNILLNTPMINKVEAFQDYTNPLAPKFNSRNSICYPAADLVAKNYLDLEAGLHQDIQMNIVTAPDVQAEILKI